MLIKMSLAIALALLTGCPDTKLPKEPPMVPKPKAADTPR